MQVKNKKNNKRKGFTLIEIMVVVVILGLLSTLVVPRIGPLIDDARRKTAASNIQGLVTNLEMYYADNGFYPTTQQGLEALVTAPSTNPIPKHYREGGYLNKVPDDPWGNPYIYRNRDGKISIISTGPDSEEGGEGINADITNED